VHRWTGGHRPIRLIAASVVLLGASVGTAVVRGAADDTSAAPTTMSTSPPSEDSRPATVAAPSSMLDPAALATPTDPSGARRGNSEAGARRAALDYLVTVRQRVVYLATPAAETVVRDWAAAGVDESVIAADVAAANQLREALAANDGQVWWVVAPLSARVAAYDGRRARVSVWIVSVAASGAGNDAGAAVTPTARYQIETVELIWDEGRWSVWAVDSDDGPAPMLAPSQTPASPAAFVAALDGFSLLKAHE
jgi:hypothetical protein